MCVRSVIQPTLKLIYYFTLLDKLSLVRSDEGKDVREYITVIKSDKCL